MNPPAKAGGRSKLNSHHKFKVVKMFFKFNSPKELDSLSAYLKVKAGRRIQNIKAIRNRYKVWDETLSDKERQQRLGEGIPTEYLSVNDQYVMIISDTLDEILAQSSDNYCSENTNIYTALALTGIDSLLNYIDGETGNIYNNRVIRHFNIYVSDPKRAQTHVSILKTTYEIYFKHETGKLEQDLLQSYINILDNEVLLEDPSDTTVLTFLLVMDTLRSRINHFEHKTLEIEEENIIAPMRITFE